MWLPFALALGLLCALLFLPGYLFFRLFSIDRSSCLLLAPPFSISLFSIMGIVYGFLGVSSNALNAAVAPTVVLALACGMRAMTRKRAKHRRKPVGLLRINWKLIALYLVFGVAINVYMFVLPLEGAASLVSSYDNLFHYNEIRSILESGYWAPSPTSLFLAMPESMVSMTPGGTAPTDGYYPTGWHILIALLMELGGCAEAVSINAANFLFVGILFPLGMYALMATLFEKKSALVCGGICCCLCAIFPWHMLIEWPLLPNLAAFCLVPLLMACFIRFCENASDRITRKDGAGERALGYPFAGFIWACIACAVIHPNSIFAAVVLLAPFVAWIAGRTAGKRFNAFAGVIVFLLACGIMVAGWIALSQASAFGRVVDVVILARQTADEAWASLTDFSFTNAAGQPVLVLLLLAGVVYLLVTRKRVWLVGALVLTACIYYVSACAEEGLLKQILTGFWYSESKRTGCLVGLAALPIISCGLAGIYELLTLAPNKLKSKNVRLACDGVIGAALTAGLLYTCFAVPAKDCEDSALSLMEQTAVENYTTSTYSPKEEAFVQEAMQIIGPDEAVINLPYDGSLIAYGITGMKTYYLERYGYGEAFETNDSRLIRTKLCAIAENEQVRDAVKNVGCAYVMLLEAGENIVWGFEQEQWLGISSIDDDTPGFTKILEKDDMRLYRIDAMF